MSSILVVAVVLAAAFTCSALLPSTFSFSQPPSGPAKHLSTGSADGTNAMTEATGPSSADMADIARPRYAATSRDSELSRNRDPG